MTAPWCSVLSQLGSELVSNPLWKYLLANKHNLGFIEFKVIDIWSLISLLSYKVWSMSACIKSVGALRFVVEVPKYLMQTTSFSLWFPKKYCLHGKAYVCFIPERKK